MLNRSKKADYGLELMLFLANKKTGKPVSLKTIAKKKKMPYSFLAQVARDLVNFGLIASKEGAGGGYYLAQAPDQISLTDISEALTENQEDNCDKCEREGICQPRVIWEEVEKKIQQEFDRKTLADLVREGKI
jgi:Rrf2 family protein